MASRSQAGHLAALLEVQLVSGDAPRCVVLSRPVAVRAILCHRLERCPVAPLVVVIIPELRGLRVALRVHTFTRLVRLLLLSLHVGEKDATGAFLVHRKA